MTFAEQIEDEIARAELEPSTESKWAKLSVIINRLAQISLLPDQAKQDKTEAFALIDALTQPQTEKE